MSSRRSSIKWLLSQIPQWEQNGWVSPEGAESIRNKYEPELSPDIIQKRIFAIIAVLGAALIGGGVILLIAYNWDAFDRGARVVLSFLPLLITQLLALYVLFNKYDSAAWREASAMGNIASIAAAIALIGQTYNIPGNLPGFLMTWLLLSLPVVLVLRASMSSFILVGQFLYWIAEVKDVGMLAYEAWILLALCLVVIIWLQFKEGREKPVLNFLCGIAVTVCVFSSMETQGEDSFLLVTIPWLATIHFLGFRNTHLVTGKVYLWVARIALLVFLFIFSFDDCWGIFKPTRWGSSNLTQHISDLFVLGLLYILSVVILVKMWKVFVAIRFVYLAPLLTMVCWILSLNDMPEVAAAAVSLYAIGLGLALILPALEEQRTSRIQLGVGIICMILLLKFFDYDMSLLSRGIAFIVTGGGFLGLNYWLSRREKEDES